MAQRLKCLLGMLEIRVQSLGQRRFPGEGIGSPLQYSCLENPMDGGAWWATVHGVIKSQTQLSDFTFHFFMCLQPPVYILEKCLDFLVHFPVGFCCVLGVILDISHLPRYTVCKYFLPFQGLSFHLTFLKYSCCMVFSFSIVIFDVQSFKFLCRPVYFFFAYAFGVTTKKSLLTSVSQRCSLFFFYSFGS